MAEVENPVPPAIVPASTLDVERSMFDVPVLEDLDSEVGCVNIYLGPNECPIAFAAFRQLRATQPSQRTKRRLQYAGKNRRTDLP